ncbi:exo-alpha-sialidase [Arcanobacterium hippocoleae]
MHINPLQESAHWRQRLSNRQHTGTEHRSVKRQIFASLTALAFGAAGFIAPAAAAETPTTETNSAQSGTVTVARWYDDIPGANRYRIPALTQANNGDILAFFDIRPGMADLPSNIGVSMRRSTDSGKTWGPIQQIRYEEGKEGFGDPSVLVDRDTGRIFVFYAGTVNKGFAGASAGNNPQDPNIMQIDYSYSDDNGITWRHKRITAESKNALWGGIFAASGEGIQLRGEAHKGRLIQQYVTSAGNVSMYSDNHGDTWKFGNPTNAAKDENKVVELSDGRLMMSARVTGGMRKVAYSDDGGDTWNNMKADGQQIDPTSNGTILRIYPDAQSTDPKAKMLMLLNSEDPDIRINATAKVSCDDGQTWPGRLQIDAEEAEYITGTPIYEGGYNKTREANGTVGIFYEREGYTELSYTQIDTTAMNMLCAPISAKANGRETDANNRNTLTAGQTANYTVDITNQTGENLPEGTMHIRGTDGVWTEESTAKVSPINAGKSGKVTVKLAVPEKISGKRTLVGTYRVNGKESQQYFFVNVTAKNGAAPNPQLKIETYLDAVYTAGAAGAVGDEAVLWARVTNTGNVPITNIRTSSNSSFNKITNCRWSNGFGPGESRLCKGNQSGAQLKHVITAAEVQSGTWTPELTVTGSYDGKDVTAKTQSVSLPLNKDALNASGVKNSETTVYLPTGDFQSSSYLRMNDYKKNSWIIPSGHPLGLDMAKNNRTSAQLLINPAKSGTLTAEVSKADGISWEIFYPQTISTVNSNQQTWPAEQSQTTDPLRKQAPNVTAHKNQPIWFVAHTAKDIPAGIVNQTITLKLNGEVIGEYPVRTTIRDVTLVSKENRPFTLDLWWHPDAIADYYGVNVWSDEHFELMKPYLAELAGAGQSVSNVIISQDPWLLEDGKPQTYSHYESAVKWRYDGSDYSFDWDIFDKLVQAQIDAGITGPIHLWGMMTFRDPQRLTYFDIKQNKMVTKKVELGNADYEKAWGQFLKAAQQHLQEKGWFNQAALAFDERAPELMNKMKATVSKVAPDWNGKIAYATDKATAQMDVSLIAYNHDIWNNVTDGMIQERRDNGKLTLLYTWAKPLKPNTITASPLISSRVLGWDVARRNLDGYLRWTFNSWPQDVFAHPAYKYAQGDEYIVYPGEIRRTLMLSLQCVGKHSKMALTILRFCAKQLKPKERIRLQWID